MPDLLQHNTLVVTDLSVLRGRPELLLRPSDGIVINDIAIIEIATGSRIQDEPAQLGRWLRAQAARLYVGNYWWDVAAYESSVNRIAPATEAIIWPLTRDLRQCALATTPEEWTTLLKQHVSDVHHNNEVGRQKFLELCRVFEIAFRQLAPTEYAEIKNGQGSDEQLTEILRTPGLVAEIAPLVA